MKQHSGNSLFAVNLSVALSVSRFFLEKAVMARVAKVINVFPKHLLPNDNAIGLLFLAARHYLLLYIHSNCHSFHMA